MMKWLLLILTWGAFDLVYARPMPFIIGGTITQRGEFPFIASLQSDGFPFCAGILIKKSWILTAAHCINPDADQMKIYVGIYNKYQRSGHRAYRPTKILKHPNYNPNKTDWDYALIKLDGESRNRPIELNTLDFRIPTEQEKPLMVMLAGWGTYDEDSWSHAAYLNKVRLPVVPTQECKRVYPGMITPRMFCVGYQDGHKNGCSGDSGGPIFTYTPSGTPLLLGLSSWGSDFGCKQPDAYTVVAKVNSAISWIQQSTK